VTAGPASSGRPALALTCCCSDSSFDTHGGRNFWQTACFRRHRVSTRHKRDTTCCLAGTYLAHPHHKGKVAQPALGALLHVVAERKRHQRFALAEIGVRPAQARRALAFSRGCGLFKLCEAPVGTPEPPCHANGSRRLSWSDTSMSTGAWQSWLLRSFLKPFCHAGTCRHAGVAPGGPPASRARTGRAC